MADIMDDLWWRPEDEEYIRRRSERYPGATDIEPEWTVDAAAEGEEHGGAGAVGRGGGGRAGAADPGGVRRGGSRGGRVGGGAERGGIGGEPVVADQPRGGRAAASSG